MSAGDRICPNCGGDGQVMKATAWGAQLRPCSRCRGTGLIDIEEGEEPG